MELDTNLKYVKQGSLSFDEDSPQNITGNSVQNVTKGLIKSRRLTKKMIVYVVPILSVVIIGLVLLFEVPYHVPNMNSTNTSIDLLGGRKDIKIDGSSIKFNIIPGNDEQWPIFVSNEMTDAHINLADCNMLDEVLLGERRARLEALKHRQLTQEQKMFWFRIHSAWNAPDLSTVPMDNYILDFMMVLSMMKHIVGKATQELRNEGYELLHDLFIEEQQTQNQTDASMDWMCALGNVTDNIDSVPYGPALALEAFNVLAEGFHLYYQEVEIKMSQDDSDKFIFGRFVYRGENPEKQYVRNVRHILNAIVRLYFKVVNPSAMKSLCRDINLETESKKAENILFNYIEESTKHPDNWYSGPAAPAMRRKRSSILKPDSMDDTNQITSKRFQSSMEMFFDKMEILSSHIDRLHERYMRLNELNDDYISREFSLESDFSNDGET